MTDRQGTRQHSRVDAMVRHHEAAIQMVRGMKGNAENEAVKDLAAAIMTAQEQEVIQMREWRRQ